MKNRIPLIVSSLLIAASASYAATATIAFTKSFEDPTEIWTAIENSGSGDYSKLLGTWCNTLVLAGGNHEVNMYIDDVFKMKAPDTTTTKNLDVFKITGDNLVLEVREGGQLNPRYWASDYVGDFSERGGRVEIEGGASLVNAGTMSLSTFIMTNNGASNYLITGEGSISGADRDKIGAASNTTAQTFTLDGSQVSVSFRRLNFVGAAGTSVDNVLGGKLEFISDENGIATINDTQNAEVFSGVVEVDFSDLVWQEEWGDSKQFTIISTSSNSDTLASWVGSADTLGKILGAEGFFSADAKHLYVTIDKPVIPEPSTYAAIFGAFALALAVYRRRK